MLAAVGVAISADDVGEARSEALKDVGVDMPAGVGLLTRLVKICDDDAERDDKADVNDVMKMLSERVEIREVEINDCVEAIGDDSAAGEFEMIVDCERPEVVLKPPGLAGNDEIMELNGSSGSPPPRVDVGRGKEEYERLFGTVGFWIGVKGLGAASLDVLRAGRPPGLGFASFDGLPPGALPGSWNVG